MPPRHPWSAGPRTIAAQAANLVLGLLLASPSHAQVRSTVVVSGLTSPVAFVQDPGDRSVQYVVEQGGRIRVVKDGALEATDFLDLSGAVSAGGERGLLGLAFPADYAVTRRFYVNFTNPDSHTVVARFRRSASNPLVADAGSRFDLRWPSGERFIRQPFANHNGGNLEFGPDGYLYIGLGDGGSGDDPFHNAQNPQSLLGKMLRIDVGVPDADPEGYDVPPDNPFVGGGGLGALPEIWAFGLRNPWRYSFDDPRRGGTGALVIGDVGQGAWEEIDYEPRGRGGRNYGWRNREGAHDHVTSVAPAFLPLVDPIYEYDHTVGHSITGGIVYRGGGLPARFAGQYFFADFEFGRVWALAPTVDPASGEASAGAVTELTDALGGPSALGLISSFGVDADAELYVVSWSLGRVLKIVPASEPAMHVDRPAPASRIAQPFAVQGWAIDRGASADAGVDAIHVWAYPDPGSGAAPIFLGATSPSFARPDVAAAFGSQFLTSGFSLTVNGLAPGRYQLVVYAHSATLGSFNQSSAVIVDVSPSAQMTIDAPANGSQVPPRFTLAGWALDGAALSGTGVDDIDVWAYPNPGSGTPPVFLGSAALGIARPDVGQAFGPRFSSAGWYLDVSNLAFGAYEIVVYARSSVTHTFDVARTVDLRVTGLPRIEIDQPRSTAVTGQPFQIVGWAADLAATTGTGVSDVRVELRPLSTGPSIVISPVVYGLARPDVAAAHGAQFGTSGYAATVQGIPAGQYRVVVAARSLVSGDTPSAIRPVITLVAPDLRMYLDEPVDGGTVSVPFTVAGWALDQSAPAGTGIDAVHVWAEPVAGSGAPAVFLGGAVLGVVRPDVAAAFGAQFLTAGFQLTTTLPPGTYRIIAYPHSPVSGFAVAQATTVRVLGDSGDTCLARWN